MTRAFAILSALLLAAAASAQVVEVVPGVHVLRGTFTPGAQPDGNTVILDANDGLVVIDTGRHAAHTDAILAYAKSTGRPIAAVVNTHWHLDHISGNAAVRAAYPDAKIYASNAIEGAQRGFLANYRKQLEQMIAAPPSDADKATFEAEIRRIDLGDKLRPDVVVTATGPKTLAGRSLTLGLEKKAVTAGDVWVLDRERGVLVAGDLLTLPAPFLDTACPVQWSASLDNLAKLEWSLVIPGHGAPFTRRQFDAYRAAFQALVQCAASTNAKEQCITGWLGGVATLGLGDERFARNLMSYYVDVLRDTEKAKTLCAD